jgi:hypothetical protein
MTVAEMNEIFHDRVLPPRDHDLAIERARQIRDALYAEGWPDPILADSGNGGHLLYRVDLPTNDGDFIKQFLEALALRF